MTALEILTELRRRGARYLAIDDRIRVQYGPEGITDTLRDEIRAQKAEILTLLNTPTHGCTSCGRFAFPAPTTCYWCRRAEARGAA